MCVCVELAAAIDAGATRPTDRLGWINRGSPLCPLPPAADGKQRGRLSLKRPTRAGHRSARVCGKDGGVGLSINRGRRLCLCVHCLASVHAVRRCGSIGRSSGLLYVVVRPLVSHHHRLRTDTHTWRYHDIRTDPTPQFNAGRMGAVWDAIKGGLALALALAEKGVFVLQGHGNPQQVCIELDGVGHGYIWIYMYTSEKVKILRGSCLFGIHSGAYLSTSLSEFGATHTDAAQQSSWHAHAHVHTHKDRAAQQVPVGQLRTRGWGLLRGIAARDGGPHPTGARGHVHAERWVRDGTSRGTFRACLIEWFLVQIIADATSINPSSHHNSRPEPLVHRGVLPLV